MENTQKQANVLTKLFSNVAGFTKTRGGRYGYSLKVNNMARKAAKELEEAGMPKEVALKMAFEIQEKAASSIYK